MPCCQAYSGHGLPDSGCIAQRQQRLKNTEETTMRSEVAFAWRNERPTKKQPMTSRSPGKRGRPAGADDGLAQQPEHGAARHAARRVSALRHDASRKACRDRRSSSPRGTGPRITNGMRIRSLALDGRHGSRPSSKTSETAARRVFERPEGAGDLRPRQVAARGQGRCRKALYDEAAEGARPNAGSSR